MAINQILRGSLSMTNTGAQASATIPSVVTSKSQIHNLGSSPASTYPTGTLQGQLELTSSTVISAYHSSGNGSTTTKYQVTERT